jgi:hypothetical protein
MPNHFSKIMLYLSFKKVVVVSDSSVFSKVRSYLQGRVLRKEKFKQLLQNLKMILSKAR